MSHAQRPSYPDQTAQILRARVPYCVLGFAPTFAIVWLCEASTLGRRPLSHLLSCALALGVLAAMAWLARRATASPERCLNLTVLAALAQLVVVTNYEVLIGGRAEVLLLAHAIFLLSAMVLLPWGLRGQLSMACGSTVLFIVALSTHVRAAAPPEALALALLFLGALSVAGAAALEGARLDAFRRGAQLSSVRARLARAEARLAKE